MVPLHSGTMAQTSPASGPRAPDDRSAGGAIPLRPRRSSSGDPEGNARLTGMTAVVLLVLLAAEGATLLSIHRLLTAHVVIGMLIVPPVLVKIGSTGWRIVRYYRGSAPYRARGAPPIPLRLLGPVVVLLTVIVLASGIVLMFVPHADRHELFFIHKVSFILWFAAMTVHVLAHLVDTARLAPADLLERTRTQVRGAGARVWALAVSLVLGTILGVVMAGTVGPWLATGGRGGG